MLNVAGMLMLVDGFIFSKYLLAFFHNLLCKVAMYVIDLARPMLEVAVSFSSF